MSTSWVTTLSKQRCALGLLGIISLAILPACTSNQTHQPDVSTEKHTSQDNSFSYRAQGNEPFWSVDVSSNNTLLFKTPENQQGVTLSANRLAYAKGVEYTGSHNNQPFTLNLRGIACADTMADTRYDMTATFEFDGQTYAGCATTK